MASGHVGWPVESFQLGSPEYPKIKTCSSGLSFILFLYSRSFVYFCFGRFFWKVSSCHQIINYFIQHFGGKIFFLLYMFQLDITLVNYTSSEDLQEVIILYILNC